jgi:peptide-methionine (S)-S-oxide reductase
VFWENHSPFYETNARQYTSIVFYHSEGQEALALETKKKRENSLGRTLYTEIIPYSDFYMAEDYHQKYYLRRERVLLEDFRAIYPEIDDFVASTAVTRVNGYVGGYGDISTLESELHKLGLSEAGENRLLEIASRGLDIIQGACPTGSSA